MLQTKIVKKIKYYHSFFTIPGFFTWQMSVNSSRQQVSFKLPSRMRSDISVEQIVRLSAVEMYKKLL